MYTWRLLRLRICFLAGFMTFVDDLVIPFDQRFHKQAHQGCHEISLHLGGRVFFCPL